ncbi:archaetidylserine decarboxylase [Pantoea sp. Mhis]|uniref:archaetidylserine decarboxylase n=1 Tax=Pantoea sp. Mhis TaxID=2576759 RepID=UPI00135B2107|nr:archaetidylserine decarboxylase [Pantoea sp. Mhis]MXP56374.1 phosphatidylserine decarboxylase [Pantoea sp. Mhis]
MFNKVKLTLCAFLPKKLLTKIVGWIANRDCGYITTIIIKIFVWFYNIDMSEVQNPNINSYHTLNDFFIRTLKKNMRPIDNDSLFLSLPADGTISQLGNIKGEQIFQAKNHFYTLNNLLGNNERLATQFLDGTFITIYLSPRDYHRIHMPCNGILSEMIYIPGKLNSLNSFNVLNIKNLFAENERLICVFKTDYGPMIQILVGAIIVGSIETVWAGIVSSTSSKKIIKYWQYSTHDKNKSIVLLKGQEMGCFRLGSTVINLFIKNHVKFVEDIKINNKTRVGQTLAINLFHFHKNTKNNKYK